jgi:phage gpG-like protein
MIELTIKKEDMNRLHKLLAELDPKKQDGAIHKGMMKASSTVLDRLVQNVSGIILKRRTGNLAKSMGWRVNRDEKGDFEAQIGSGASLRTDRMIYANIHETGGIIRPTRAKMLTIPLSVAKTPAGVSRFTAREVRDGLTQYSGSFIRRSKAGNLIIFGTRGDKVVPLFILKDQVTVPARRYMSITVDQTKDQVVQDIVDKIKEAKEKQ